MNYLTTDQAKTLTLLLHRRPRIAHCPPTEAFVLAYVFFEACLRLVLKFYRERLGAATSVASANSIIRKDVVSRAFLYFAISITANDIDHLLDAKKVKRGSKSARMLRNGLIHEWNEEDAHEVIEREVEIMDALNLTTNAVCAAASPPSPSADV